MLADVSRVMGEARKIFGMMHGMGEIYDTKVRYRNVFGIYNNIMSDCFI